MATGVLGICFPAAGGIISASESRGLFDLSGDLELTGPASLLLAASWVSLGDLARFSLPLANESTSRILGHVIITGD